MKEVPMLNLRREYEYMKEDIDAAIRRCLEHQRWILGPEVQELEDAGIPASDIVDVFKPGWGKVLEWVLRANSSGVLDAVEALGHTVDPDDFLGEATVYALNMQQLDQIGRTAPLHARFSIQGYDLGDYYEYWLETDLAVYGDYRTRCP